MANYASIRFVFFRAASPTQDDSFGFSMSYPGGNALVAEIPVQTRSFPGEFTAGDNRTATILKLIQALTTDYQGSDSAQIVALPISILFSSAAEITITATEYGVSFQHLGGSAWWDLVEIIEETPPTPTELYGTVTHETSDNPGGSYPPCDYLKFNIAFTNAVYPVTLEGPVGPGGKVFNNPSEAYWYWIRGTAPIVTITCTDAEGKVFTQTQPTADRWTIAPPLIVEQSPGFTVTAQRTLNYKGSIRATLSYKLDAGQWRAQPIFYNVGAGTHTIYIKDQYGCEQSIEFQCGEPETTKVYLADDGQRCERVARIVNPLNTPERINMHIVLPTLSKEIFRSLPAVEVDPDVYEVTFDINNILSGELEDYLFDKERFTFPAQSGNYLVDRSDLLLEFYTEESYSYIDTDNNLVPSGRTDNSAAAHHYAVYGGVDDEMQGYLYSKDLTFDDWLKSESEIKWFTNMPNELPVHPTQPVRLWLLNNNAMSDMRLKATAYYTDGTNSGIIEKEVETEAFMLCELCCGVSELGLDTINILKTVSKYEVWIDGLQGASPISTVKKSFVVDRSYYERNDILFSSNSLGVHEVLWCHGRASEQINLQGKSSIRPLSTPSLTRGTIRARRGTYTDAFAMNTGWFPKVLRHYLIDLISAGEAVLPVDYFLRPVLIGNGKYDMGKDDEDLFALSFDMQIAHSYHHYTKLPDEPSPWGQFSDTFNESFYI